MYKPKKDVIADFASFKLHYKEILDLRNGDNSEWHCEESNDFIHLFVPEHTEDRTVQEISVPEARHSILIDKELNVKIESKDKEIYVFLPEGEPLASYSQLLTTMYVLTESSAKIEEYMHEEWLDNDASELDSMGTLSEANAKANTLENEEKSAVNISRMLQCSFCPKIFTRPVRRREHENVHTGRKPYVCTICYRAFSASSILFAHRQLHHGVRNHACPDCGKKFHRKRNMTLHHRLVHLKEKPYACPICQRPYTDYTCFKRHIERHAQNDSTIPKNSVSISSAPKKDSVKVKKHELPHRKPDQLKQPKQPKAAPNGARRKRNTLPKRHPCELCGLMFARRRNVEYHLKYTHTGIKPHECEFCGKKYSDITSFKRHIRAHTEISGQQQSATGEDIVFQRNEFTGLGDQNLPVLQDFTQNTVITSYMILN